MPDDDNLPPPTRTSASSVPNGRSFVHTRVSPVTCPLRRVAATRRVAARSLHCTRSPAAAQHAPERRPRLHRIPAEEDVRVSRHFVLHSGAIADPRGRLHNLDSDTRFHLPRHRRDLCTDLGRVTVQDSSQYLPPPAGQPRQGSGGGARTCSISKSVHGTRCVYQLRSVVPRS